MDAMYVIPITPFTVPLITELNGGVRPVRQDVPTFFVLRTSGSAEIITYDEWKAWEDMGKPITIHQYPR